MKAKTIVFLVCRLLLGALFVFSGFVKAIDPWGSAYKFEEYFTTWHLQFLDFVALPASFFLSALEFVLGVCLLLGVYRTVVSLLSLLFMCFMTPLTLYLAIFNPVTDCGCFGDAWVITNWQTFFKNILLLTMAVLVFLWRKHSKFRLKGKKISCWATVIAAVGILSLSFYCYYDLPLMDFRPYKIGNNIDELRQIPEGAPQDEYSTVLIYEKDGVKQKFTIENYPKEGWTFVDAISTLVKKGYEPPVHDFTITTLEGDDITDEVLSDPSYSFLLIAHRIEKAGEHNSDLINEIYEYAQAHQYRFLALTASLPEHIEEWREATCAEYPFATMDATPLKTIVRSNPGLVLLHHGVVVGKWSHNKLPDQTTLDKIINN
ncbi:MAG: DoxX family protein [Candidatus Symbiothrix sp.]|jgi:uncharacterized membrane protein YphA (DoxX/SURF4 family)|nr:DoxX family protein [Candidatus Symbiothrix sp.]